VGFVQRSIESTPARVTTYSNTRLFNTVAAPLQMNGCNATPFFFEESGTLT